MLTDDWKRYLKDPTLIDYGIFAPLLTDVENPVRPEDVFRELPNGLAICTRIDDLLNRTVFNGLYYLPAQAHRQTNDQLARLATEQALELSAYLKDEKQFDLAGSLKDLHTELITDTADFYKLIDENRPNLNEGVDFALDDFITAKGNKDVRFFGAGEAILHLTMMPYVTHHILNAAVGFPISFKPGFELYIGGGRCAYLDDRILLLVPES